MIRDSIYRLCAGLVACLALAAAPSFAVDSPTATFVPVVDGPPETRSTPFISWFGDLSRVGYVEEEYLISGGANVYKYVDDAGQSPEVQVLEAEVPYTSRILVRKPTRKGRFNGTVYVEILNPTAGWDGDAVWNMNNEYLIREGAVYVGLSSKPVAVNFLAGKNTEIGRFNWGQPPLVERNASRYASLSMPFFGQVWDMLSELGLLLKSSTDSNNPLYGLDVERVIMTGYSQSAGYQVTYANSFHTDATMPDGSPIYDGYYIAAGGPSAKQVNRIPPATENLPPGDARTLVMVNVPVIRFQTETEIFGFAPGSVTVRQTEPSYPLMRFYEMAGGSHADLGTNEVSGPALFRDLGFPDFAAFCNLPLNPIRISYVQSALLDALDRWVRGDQLPPPSRLVELTTDGTAIALDADGNALGGVRPATLEVPLGNYLAFNTGGGFCFLFGGFVPFDDAQLRSRYRNHGQYVKRLTTEATRAVRERFLLQPDAQALRGQAAQSSIGK